MYSIRTTPGLIIGSKPHGEAGKILFIFSKEFGLINVSAAGLRLEKSKLRYHTSDYSFGVFSLVKGKEFWKLTNAASYQGRDNVECNVISDQNSISLIGRISALLRKLVHGEEAHAGVFDCLESLFVFLSRENDLNEEQMKTIETLTLIRILKHLGYVANSKDHQVFIDSFEYNKDILGRISADRLILNGLINKAIKESQL